MDDGKIWWMILCDKCRREIKNPDPATFDFNLKCIIYPDGNKKFPSISNWRILSIILAHGENKLIDREILYSIWDGVKDCELPNDPGHNIRERLRIIRKDLEPTNWKIITRGNGIPGKGGEIYLARKSYNDRG